MSNKTLSTANLALLAILTAAVIGGGMAVLTKIALKEIPTFSFTFFRFVAASLSILPFFLKDLPKIKKNFSQVIGISLIFCVNMVVYAVGLQTTTATIAQTLYVSVPIIAALISYKLLSERFTLKKILGIVTGFLGALIIILLPVFTKSDPFSGNLTGNLFIIVGVLCTAFYTVYSKKFQKDYTPLQLTAILSFTACIGLFFFAVSDMFTHPMWWTSVSTISLFAILYLGILGTTVYYLMFQYAIKHGSPIVATMILYLQPAATFVWAALLLGEQLTAGLLIGAILAFIGVSLVLKSK